MAPPDATRPQGQSHDFRCRVRRQLGLVVVGTVLSAAFLIAAPAAHAAPKDQRVTICHVTGKGKIVQLEVAATSLQAHLAHGDGLVGDAIPGMDGYRYGSHCSPERIRSCTDLPPVDGTPSFNSAADGWQLVEGTTDLVSGNGPWPGPDGSPFTVSDVVGSSRSGGEMQLLIALPGQAGNMVESVQTELRGLTPGEELTLAFEWQQATLSRPGRTLSGGTIDVVVDGVTHTFTSDSESGDHGWEVALIDVVATADTLTVVVRSNATGASGTDGQAAVVFDAGGVCTDS